MTVIEFYKDFSDAKEIHLVQDGKTIADNFPSIQSWKDYKIIVNNTWNEPSHIVRPTDKIIIRKIPMGTAVAIAMGVIALGVAIYSGVEGYKAKKEAEKSKEYLDKLKANSKDEVVNVPYLKGASNSVATGKTQPYIIGKNLFTPYILNGGRNYKGYSTISGIDGKDQFYNVVLECGFRKQNLKKIYCDDVTLKTFDTEECQEGIFSLESGSVFASEDSFIEVAQDGNPFETDGFNQKIIEKTYSDLLKQHDKNNPEDYEDLFYTLESNSMGADVCILFNGLKKYLDDGTPGNKTRHVVPSYSVDYAHLVAIGDSDPLNNASWVEFSFDQNGTPSNEFTRNTLVQMRFNAHVDFDFDDLFVGGAKRYEEPITIRLSTPDEKPESGSEYSDCYVQWVHSYCYDVKKTKTEFIADRIIAEREARLSTVMGVRIKSTTANEDKLKSIQIVTSGVARTWNKSTKTWSEAKTPTSNPASWLLEVLTSDCHNPSRIDDEEIDLNSLGQWYEYCDRENHKLTVNHVISAGMTKSSLFDLICDCGHAYMYQNIYGKIAIAIDCEKENAIAVLNEQNMVSFSYTKDVRRKPDGLKLSYIDAESGYQENTVGIMYDGSNFDDRSADSIVSSLTIQGKTNHDEVCRYGYYLMKKERLRPKVAKATIGNEGLYFTPLSKVLVQHPSLKIGKGNGEIKDVVLSDNLQNITGLVLYDSVDLSETQNYSFIVQCVGSFGSEDYCTPLQIEVIGGKGITKEIEFVTPIPVTAKVIPHELDVFSYGLGTENVVDQMVISAIESNDGGFTLSLVDYDERIYDESQTIPEYISDFSTPQIQTSELPEKPIVSFDDLFGVKKDVEDDTDRKIASATFDASPTYSADFNTLIIKKDNTGSYTPSFITANGYENKGLTEQNPFSGKWFIYVNNSTTEFNVITGSSMTLNIQDILDSGIENIDTIEVQFKTNDEKLTIKRELIQVLTGASAYSVRLSNPSIVLEGNENKSVTETIVKTKAMVYYGLKELSYKASDGWEYGIINAPDGMDLSVDVQSGEITIKILEGTALSDLGSLEIPIFIHSQTSTQIAVGFTSETRATKMYVVGFNGKAIGFFEADENGYYNTYFTWQKLTQNAVKLASLTQTVNNYWNILTDDLVVTVAEKNTLERLFGSLTADFTKYTEQFANYGTFGNLSAKYQALKEVVEVVLSASGNYTFNSKTDKDTFNQKFENYYSAKADIDAEISKTDTNFTRIDSTTRIAELTPKVNDFFVWVGDNNTRYGATVFLTGMTYCWNGSAWIEDNNQSHIMTTMNEALEKVKDSKDDSIPAVVMAKRLIAMQVVTDTLISNYASIKKLEAGEVVIGGYKTEEGGSVQSFITDNDVSDSVASGVKTVTDNIYTPGTTKIDGAKITTGSVKADSIDTDDLFAQNIEATNMHLKGDSTVEGTVYAKAGQFEGGIGSNYTIDNNTVMHDPTSGNKLFVVYARLEFGLHGENALYRDEPLLMGIGITTGQSIGIRRWVRENLYPFYQSENLLILETSKTVTEEGKFPKTVYMNQLRYTGEYDDGSEYLHCDKIYITEMLIAK